MRLGLFLILILLIGSVAAHFLLENNGYVLINFRGYTVEMSVPVLDLRRVSCLPGRPLAGPALAGTSRTRSDGGPCPQTDRPVNASRKDSSHCRKASSRAVNDC